MPSFKNKRPEEIRCGGGLLTDKYHERPSQVVCFSSAVLMGKLQPPERENDDADHYSGCETWHCAFAPDESYFGWSCGNRLISLVPWNRCKSTLASENDVDGEGNQFAQKQITIDTGCLVRSIAFGSSTSDNSHMQSSVFWRRFSMSKDLILATGHSNGRIRTWDIFTGKLILELMDHKDMVSDVSFAPDGSLILVSTCYDGTLKVWDLKDDGNMFKTLRMNNRPIYSCCWSPNARLMVSVGMCKVAYVWETKTFTLKHKLTGHHHDIVACDFSPDGSLIATASWDTRVILWDSYSGNLLKTFGHLFPPPRLIYASGANGTWIRGLSFCRDGAHLATVADDGYVRFWDVICEDDPEAVGSMEEALCCTYSPSGRVLAVGTRKGAVAFWHSAMCVKSLLYLCRLTIRSFMDPSEVSLLPIPKRLTDYLLYSEWE